MSWFKYEELIEGWLDPVLKETKRGPALENRLVGNAERYKGLLNCESSSGADGVKYFRDTFSRHFIHGAQRVSLEKFDQLTRGRGNLKMINWIGQCS